VEQSVTWSRRHVAVLALTIAIALLRVAATHRVFSATIDEQAHIASGYDWWDGRYTTDPTHPPLARIFFGLPLRILDVPAPKSDHFASRGNELLHHEERYRRNLSWARRANLLFLAAAILGVALWAARLFGPTTACLAAILFSLLPPILAHAGVATTDLAVAAALPFVILAMDSWVSGIRRQASGADRPGEDPQRRDARRRELEHTIILGLIVGLGLLTKFSFAPFCAIVCLVLVALQWRVLRRAHLLVFAAVLSLVVVWAAYRFQFAPMSKVDDKAHPTFTRLAPSLLRFSDEVPIPAPGYFAGLAAVALHDREGHYAYLLGECRQLGWWYYFPVALFVKTPLAFLILALWGARSRVPLVIFLALLAYCMTASINIGIRHVLPLYAPLSLLAALGLTHIWRTTRGFDFGRVAAAGLAAWLVVAGVRAHPDYLAYFNETASTYPQRVLVDSNLDWGQDLKRLSGYARERGIERIGVLLATTDDISRFGLVAYGLEPWIKPQGWIAVSHTALAYNNCRSEGFRWLRNYQPVKKIGKGIEVYWIPSGVR
jgi:4-amino-4-deoxy-L-arabinose transferase-like glycosyltransferase